MLKLHFLNEIITIFFKKPVEKRKNRNLLLYFIKPNFIMRKNLLFTLLLCGLSTFTFAQQRVLLDFDNEKQTFGTCFGTGAPDNSDCHTVIENPDKSGINTSDSVGTFIEPAAGETWMGMYFDIINGGDIDMTGAETTLCADVWVGTSVPFTFKLENTTNGATPYEGGQITPANTSQWETVCDDMATFANVADRLVLFFNIAAVPAAETTYYFDNVIHDGVTSVTGLIEEKGLEIFPNPTTHNLRFNADGTPMTIIVTDMMGREVLRHINFTDNNIRVSDFANGMYAITFIDETTGRMGSAKFVKR